MKAERYGIDELNKKLIWDNADVSNKYKKPLSVRFVSDGKAKTGEKTDFQNKYLIDVIVRKL